MRSPVLFLASALAFVVPAAATTPATGSPLETALSARFAALQARVRPGLPAQALKITESSQSLFDQSNEGIVRVSLANVKAAPSAEILDALLLIGLSDAVNTVPRPASLGKTTKAVANVLGFLGSTVAEAQADRVRPGSVNVIVGQYQPQNLADAPETINVSQRALIWAKANGGCEARIVGALKTLAALPTPSHLAGDARLTLKQLGRIAWTPDDRCAETVSDPAFEQLRASL